MVKVSIIPISDFTSSKFYFVFRGLFANLFKTFEGKDLIFTSSSRLFFFTKSSYFAFLSAYYFLKVGAEHGFFLEIKLVGLGFRYIRYKESLLLRLGHSHYIRFPLALLHPIGHRKRLILLGPDYADLMQSAAILRSFRKPDVYKNKGIQISGTTMRLKVGKKK